MKNKDIKWIIWGYSFWHVFILPLSLKVPILCDHQGVSIHCNLYFYRKRLTWKLMLQANKYGMESWDKILTTVTKRLELTSFSLLLGGGLQRCPPRNEFQQPFDLLVLKQVSPVTTHFRWQRSALSGDGSVEFRKLCSGPKLTGSGQKKRQISLHPVGLASSLPPSSPLGSWHQLHRSAPPVGAVWKVRHQTGLVILIKYLMKDGWIAEDSRGHSHDPQPHLQPCKHPRPLVAKAIGLHGPQLFLRCLLVHLLLHLPVKLLLLLILIFFICTFTASFWYI